MKEIRGMLVEESKHGSFRSCCFLKVGQNDGKNDFTCLIMGFVLLKPLFYKTTTWVLSPLERCIDTSPAPSFQITLEKGLFMDKRLVIGQILNTLSLFC